MWKGRSWKREKEDRTKVNCMLLLFRLMQLVERERKKKPGSEALKKLVFKLLLFSPEEVKVAYEAARRKWVGE